MPSHLAGSLLILGLLGPAATAQTGPVLNVQPGSRLWVEGSSTLRRFECRAPSFDVTVQTSTREPLVALMDGVEAVSSVEVTIPARRLECGNETMNAHMYKALKVGDAPLITFRLSTYDLVPSGSGKRVMMGGTLLMGGAERPITLQAEAVPAENGTLRVTGSKELRMSEFGLKPPTLMLGTLRVADGVNVRFDLVLKPAQPAT